MSELYIGIMTGTSMDGIDVVIAQFEDFPKVISESSLPINSELRKILLDLATKQEINIDLFIRTHFLLASEFAKAVEKALEKAGLTAKNIRAIGLHGQTIRHLPKAEEIVIGLDAIGATFQLGSGSALASLTGIDVVSDFRSGDLALGGEGAPLVPMFDEHFLRSNECDRIALNIGGIANVTFLHGNSGVRIIAFDKGQGNMIIDDLMKELLNKPYDEGGNIAKNGKIDEKELAELLKNEYFNRIPPKSTGRELFSSEFTAELKKKVNRGAIFADDAIATVTELTAITIANAISFLPLSPANKTEIFASGGGVKNVFLCERIQGLSPQIKFRTSDELGIPSQAKEALAFAWFAKRTR